MFQNTNQQLLRDCLPFHLHHHRLSQCAQGQVDHSLHDPSLPPTVSKRGRRPLERIPDVYRLENDKSLAVSKARADRERFNRDKFDIDRFDREHFHSPTPAMNASKKHQVLLILSGRDIGLM